MTLLVLDPDLFYAAETNPKCNYLLDDIAEKIKSSEHQLVLDNGGDVEKEFLDWYLRQSAHGRKKSPIVQIYDRIAKGFRNRVVDRSSEPVHQTIKRFGKSLEEFLEDHHCQKPVEPHLMRMAYRARSVTGGQATVLIVGDGIHCSGTTLRLRGSNDAKVRTKLDKINIQVQSVSDLVSPVREPGSRPDIEPSHVQAQNFERAVNIKMQSMFGGQILDPVPLNELGLGKMEDIDVYVYETSEEPRRIWIGECRLYKEGVESEQLVEYKKIDQLRKRLPKVKVYEEQQTNSEEIKICGLLISNAHKTDRESWLQFVDEMKELGIEVAFYQAVLKKGWGRPNEVSLRIIEPLELIPEPFDTNTNI